MCRSVPAFLQAAVFLLAIATVAGTPVGSMAWQQSIASCWATYGSQTVVFPGKFYAKTCSKRVGTYDFVHWLAVFDSSSGRSLLQMDVAPLALTPAGTTSIISDIQMSAASSLICAAVSGGNITCGDLHSGKKIMNTSVDNCTSPKIAFVGSGSLAVACQASLALIATATGSVETIAKSDANAVPAVTISGATAYVIGADGIHAFDLATRKEKWSTAGDTSYSQLICATPATIVLLDSSSALHAYRAADGKRLWHTGITNAVYQFGHMCVDDVMWYTVEKALANVVVARSLSSGSELYRIDGQVKDLVLDPARAQLMRVRCSMFPPPTTRVEAFESGSGKLLWNTSVPLHRCGAKGYILSETAPVDAQSPVSLLPSGHLVVPNIIGANFLSATGGEPLISEGRASLRFAFLHGFETAVASGEMVVIERQPMVNGVASIIIEGYVTGTT